MGWIITSLVEIKKNILISNLRFVEPVSTSFSSATLPEREDPGDETVGDPGGERCAVGEVNRLGDIADDGDTGGEVSSSIGENIRRGDWSDEQPDSDPTSSLSQSSRFRFLGLFWGLF